MTIDFHWKVRRRNEWADCEMLHPASAVNPAQGTRLITPYASSWKKVSLVTSRRWSCVCWVFAAAGCPAVKPTGFSPVCGRWRSSSPVPCHKKKKKELFNLELLLLRAHITFAAPLATDINQNVAAVLGWISSFGGGGGGLIEFYLDFIKHLDKPIKEVADCRHQHLIHHAVVGVKSDWH